LPLLDLGVGILRRMIHLSELHGAATHLAVVAIPLFAVLYALRRAGVGGDAVVQAERWALGAGVVGVAAAGLTGLLVWGQAQTELRGQSFRLGNAHFWIGIGLAVLVAIPAVAHVLAARRGTRRPAARAFEVVAALAVVAVVVQGYLGGRMTYHHGVGIQDGGQFADTAVGADRLDVARAKGADMVAAGREAFSEQGLGCARCHGDQAQGMRGPSLAGGAQLEDFRRVHGHGLFPARVVTDQEFSALNAWLRTLRG
jgi:mono/diheme cytochrome c family protein